MRDVLDALSTVIAVALLVVAVLASVAAARLPMEAGGLLFSPLLFGGALYAFFGAVRLLVPVVRRRF